MQPVFDGHNDVLLRLWQLACQGDDPVAAFIDGTPQGQLDLPRAQRGGLVGGLCAIYVPSDRHDLAPSRPDARGHYASPLAAPVERHRALDVATAFVAIAKRIERAGGWRLCTSVEQIESAIDAGSFAAVLHMEGCEPLDEGLEALELFHAAGMRSLGPVWSRNNAFGHGVPFAFPMSPDTGPGLTDAGRRLVRECDRLGVMIDLAHITERGFWDVAELSQAPLVASHSNPHALVPVARNLTDRQLDAIRERRGLVGLNYATTMLRADARANPATPLDVLRRHLDYLIERVGIDCVALGSDFDGAPIPAGIKDAAGLPNLVDTLTTAGYDAAMLEAICRSNWLRVLGECWKRRCD